MGTLLALDDRAAATGLVSRVAPAGMTGAEALPEPFDAFYRREYAQVVGLGHVLTGNHWAAEDLAQQAFTEAHRRWDRIGRYDNPGAWVRRVLVNKSTSRFRRVASETRAITRIKGRRQETVQPTERTTEVWAAVRRLPPRQAQTIALYYWEDRSLAQIAEILECSSETVKTHLKRARATLSGTLAGLEGL